MLEYLEITATAGTEGTSMAFLRKPNEGSGNKTTSENLMEELFMFHFKS